MFYNIGITALYYILFKKFLLSLSGRLKSCILFLRLQFICFFSGSNLESTRFLFSKMPLSNLSSDIEHISSKIFPSCGQYPNFLDRFRYELILIQFSLLDIPHHLSLASVPRNGNRESKWFPSAIAPVIEWRSGRYTEWDARVSR